MTKKNKIIAKLTAPMTAVAATTSAAVPLVTTITSCSDTTLNTPNYDKEYGVSQKTYEDMKGRFQYYYEQEMIHQGYHGDALKEKMNEFGNTLATFDDATSAQPSRNRYTTATSSLVHFAKTQYGITLERDQYLSKKITWSSIEQMFQGLKRSCDIYLQNTGISDEQRNIILQDASDEYNRMTSNLKTAYPNDTLSAIIKAQTDLVKCFEDVNEQIGLVAAQCRLKDFMTTYNISYKDSPEQNGIGVKAIDAELNNSIGKTLSNTLMNKVFEFTNVTEGKTVTFRNDIIPSHIVNPVLTRINKNKYSNKYSLDIDWQIYKDNKDNTPEQIKRRTAHLYLAPNTNKFNEEGILLNDNENINDLMLDAPVVPTGYGIKTTAKYAQASVVDTYFNKDSEDGYISDFHWSKDTSKPNKWEVLFANQDDKSPIKHLTIENLAESGLELVLTNHDGTQTQYTLTELLSSIVNSKVSDEDLNLAQKFVKYCDLNSDVTILHDEENNHEASAKFFVAYHGEQPETLQGYDIAEAKNFAISEEIYAATNIDFNTSYESFDTYRNKGIKGVVKAARGTVIGITVSLLAQALTTAKLAVWAYKTPGNPAKLARKWGILIMSLAESAIATGAAVGVYKATDPVFDFDKKMGKMQDKLKSEWSEKGTTFNKIVEKFENDHEKYFVLWKTDKNPDARYQTKKQDFGNLPWVSSDETKTTAKALKGYYHDFLSSKEWNDIQTVATQYKVAPKDFKNVSDKFKDKVLSVNLTAQLGSIAATGVIDGLMTWLMKSSRKAEPQTLDDVEGEEIVEEQVEDHKMDKVKQEEYLRDSMKMYEEKMQQLDADQNRIYNELFPKDLPPPANNLQQYNDYMDKKFLPQSRALQDIWKRLEQDLKDLLNNWYK